MRFQKTHGLSRTPTYQIWFGMKKRCLNPKSKKYKDYGGKGIKICERWMDFKNFYEDMGERPDGLEIDRIDNNGNYEKGNCRWATHSEQQLNKNAYGELGLKGITRNGKSFASKIYINRKPMYLGTYKCPLLAVIARENKITELGLRR